MSFLTDLNDVQRLAVQHINGPVLIVAGAGSGKTRVLTYRTAHLIQIGVPSYQLLVLTFTNKAAEEMKSRIVSLVGEKSKNIWMGTFHSMFARILRKESDRLGYTGNFTIYDTEDSETLIKNILNESRSALSQYRPSTIRAKISSLKSQLIKPQEYEVKANLHYEQHFVEIYKKYQKRLKNSNAMDFDDLLLLTLELFRKYPDILDKYQDRFRYILVDEYQDTNRAQYEVIKLLANKYRNVCVVGDDAQSIYSFRGADIKNILSFEKDFPECKIFRLEQNYRSTKLILNAAYQVIRNNKKQIEKNLWTENPTGEPITLINSINESDEGEKVAQYIKSSLSKYKIDFKDVAVLYRTNSQSRSIEDALRRNNIPYIIIGGVEFYKRKEVKDVLAYLKLIVNSKDDVSFRRIVNYPARGIGDVTMKYLEVAAIKYNTSLFEAIPLLSKLNNVSDKAVEKLEKFYSLINKYILLKSNLSPSELSRNLVEEVGFLREYKEDGTPESLARWYNIQELLSAITEHSSKFENATLESFLQEISLYSEIDKWDNSNNAVTLMTIHSAKGLEFEVVFITGMEEGLLPISQSLMYEYELEEERRLFYVGITRTRRKLFLSLAHQRFLNGEISINDISRFVKEIDREFIIEQVSNFPKLKQDKIKDTKHQNNGFYDYANESQIPVNLQVGLNVFHDKFGKGKILELSGRGDNTKVIVKFDRYGVKNLMLKYANLKVK